MKARLFIILLVGLLGCQSAPQTVTPTAVATPVNNLVPERRRLNVGELILAASPDDIPAIFADDTIFVDPTAGSAEWADEELVIGLTIGEESRAYPIALLSLHEVVNDTVGGQPVLVTWCPLCFSAIVFDRVVDGRSLTFGVSGYLYYDNLVMFDHQSETLWSQLLGQSLKGGFRGVQLEMLPSQLVTWGEWKSLHPDTDQPGIIRDGETGSQWDTRTGLAIVGHYTGQRLQQIAAPLVYWIAWASIHQGSDIYGE